MAKHALPAILLSSSVLLFSTGVAALGNLENPQPGGWEGGIGAITGWHCTSRSIEVRIDGVSLGLAGAGTSRDDTIPVCGHSDTGFSLLFNYNLLQGGTHQVDAYADGVLFGSATFQAGYLGSEFLTGLSAAHTVPDFPVKGQGTQLQWQQSKQNFVVTGMQPLTGGSIVGTYSITNFWYQDSSGKSISTLAPGTSVSGTQTFGVNGMFSLAITLSVNGQNSSTTGSGPYVDGGYYVQTGTAEIDLVIERGDTLTLFNISQQSATTWAAVVVSAVRTPTASADQVEAAASSTPAGGTDGLLHTIRATVGPGAN